MRFISSLMSPKSYPRQCLIFFCIALYALPGLSQDNLSGEAYLKRFESYLQWTEKLPDAPTPAFQRFIQDDLPLSNKLRDRWLYKLAQSKNWNQYLRDYQPTQDINLQCFEKFARYQQGKTAEALKAAKAIWLSPQSLPPGCTQLFSLLQKSPLFTKELISQRISLALEQRNISLASYLLTQFTPARRTDQKLLLSIHQKPYSINQMGPGDLHGEFYLYGLKQLVNLNTDRAISYWKTAKTQRMLTHAQKQSFLAHLALYTALRNHATSQLWFSKIEPAYYTDTLLDWQIRHALKQQQWKRVGHLIPLLRDKENPAWQYWLARSLEAQGQKKQAVAIYAKLAETRHYYGFLASFRLHQKPHFQNENYGQNKNLLKPYQSLTNQIKVLYAQKKMMEASRLLNDFSSELPKADKIALVHWVAQDLKWHAKSFYLSDNDELSNQLNLRFPLNYQKSIHPHSAKNRGIPAAFIYAIIRQESSFREDVISAAGARGLMQIMPATAKLMAKVAKIPYQHPDQLYSAPRNISIGIAYLSSLSKRFSDHPILMAAAYNAGPGNVVNWLKKSPPKQMDIWVETLPFPETRNYLKNIIAFYTVYEYRMQHQASLKQIMRPVSS